VIRIRRPVVFVRKDHSRTGILQPQTYVARWGRLGYIDWYWRFYPRFDRDGTLIDERTYVSSND
jgi:hypothetical protein